MEVSVRFRATAVLSSEKDKIYLSNERSRVVARKYHIGAEKILSCFCQRPNPYSSVIHPLLITEVRREDSCWPITLYVGGIRVLSLSFSVHASAQWSKAELYNCNVGPLKSAQASRHIRLLRASREIARLAYGGGGGGVITRWHTADWLQETAWRSKTRRRPHIQREM